MKAVAYMIEALRQFAYLLMCTAEFGATERVKENQLGKIWAKILGKHFVLAR